MNTLRRNYDLALEALEELTAELGTKPLVRDDASQPRHQPADRTLEQTLNDFHPLPSNALFLGIAEDNLPVLLNLHDPTPGPILIAGDEGCGKTALMQTIADASTMVHSPKAVQFSVITPHPEEWQGFSTLAHCEGIFPTFDNTTTDFVSSLADWARKQRKPKQSHLLFIDDLESITQADDVFQQNLRWLLLRGPNRQVWPLVTVNAERSRKLSQWLDAFQTRLFGRIDQASIAEEIVPTRGAALHRLQPPTQFQMLEGSNWVRFQIPSSIE